MSSRVSSPADAADSFVNLIDSITSGAGLTEETLGSAIAALDAFLPSVDGSSAAAAPSRPPSSDSDDEYLTEEGLWGVLAGVQIPGDEPPHKVLLSAITRALSSSVLSPLQLASSRFYIKWICVPGAAAYGIVDAHALCAAGYDEIVFDPLPRALVSLYPLCVYFCSVFQFGFLF